MDVEESVADSLADDDEYVIWQPDLEFSDVNVNDRKDKVKRSSFGLGDMAPYRSLRKRKAIQKMPYSLDRIRHEQMLQGYDVSNFDALADNLELPVSGHMERKGSNAEPNKSNHAPGLSRSITHKRQPRQRELRGNDEEEEDDEDDDDERVVLPHSRPHERKVLLDSQQYSESSGSDFDDVQDKSQEKIIFRGKVIDFRDGYKGIMPKVAWKKSLSSDDKPSGSSRRENRTIITKRRGVAVRKMVKQANNETHQDMIIPDYDLQEGVVDEDISIETKPAKETHELKQSILKQYFESKYSKSYKYDDLSDEDSSDATDLEYLSNDDVELQRDIFDYAAKDEASGKDYYTIDSDMDENYGHDSDAIESDEGTIDKMLNNSRSKNYKYGNKKRVLNGNRMINKTNKKTTFAKKIRKRSTRKDHLLGNTRKLNCNYKINSVKDGPKNNGQTGNLEAERQKAQEKNKAYNIASQTQRKIGMSAILEPPRSMVLYEKPKLFVPVIEGLADEYKLMKRHIRLNRTEEIMERKTVGELKTVNESQVFSSVLNSKNFDPPLCVKIELPSKTFILSRLDRDVNESLGAIFQYIVEVGVVNEEIVDMSVKISEFLCYMDQPDLYRVIDDFHRKFRAKVNLLKCKAKPIHFYQIAVCQFMYLEISKFSNLSAAKKTSIEQEIIDHIVSFFGLLSRCYNALVGTELNLLYKAYDILRAIIHHLGQLNTLWQRLTRQQYCPQVCHTIVSLFPTHESHWRIVKADHNFASATEWLVFIRNCSSGALKWEFNNELVLQLYEYFKTRKFTDFEEELKKTEYSDEQSNNIFNYSTIFESFLGIIERTPLSVLTLERITPIGTIQTTVSLKQLNNRLNLLLSLAKKAQYSYEKRYDELVMPFFKNTAPKSIDIEVFSSILDGEYKMIDICLQKKLEPVGKLMNYIWKYVLIQNDEIYCSKWEVFLDRLNVLLPQHKTVLNLLLKSMSPVLHQMLATDPSSNLTVKLVGLFVPNLEALGPEWVEAHLFRSLAVPAKSNVTILNQYCSVIQYLAESNVITWWSVLNYNLFDGDSDIMLSYYTNICSMSDDSFFCQVKKTMYTKVIDLLLVRYDHKFRTFLQTLSKRDPLLKLDVESTSSHLQLIKKVIRAFSQASHNDLLVKFVAKVRNAYLQDNKQRDFYYSIVNFLNNNFVDQIRNAHEFKYLKNEFGISNEETEKSIFRDHLLSLQTDTDRCVFVETELIQMLSHKKELSSFIVKLQSALQCSVFENSIKSLTDMIRSHPLRKPRNTLHVNAAYILLHILNGYFVNNCGLVVPDEFYELIKLQLHFSIDSDIYLRDTDLSTTELLLEMEIVNLQRTVVTLSYGFKECPDLVGAYLFSTAYPPLSPPQPNVLNTESILNDNINHFLNVTVKNIVQNVDQNLTIELPSELLAEDDKSVLAQRDALVTTVMNDMLELNSLLV
ncbi:HER222Cp [Eremothecium sinecaudum]|uniref:HER222Cp n=1 Tax=Eremothecium sinecaudum TaxID=45286 RepID=A0A0X8HU74_9SACH|nr:HER222Cp [Eremothecium sinecaudum]AMD21500.1 HER222Cp [Eremothecium sinecaudum]